MMNLFYEMMEAEIEKHEDCGWWNVFDSDDFEKVCKAIADHEGWTKENEHEDWWDVCARNSEKFVKWSNEMAEDL